MVPAFEMRNWQRGCDRERRKERKRGEREGEGERAAGEQPSSLHHY